MFFQISIFILRSPFPYYPRCPKMASATRPIEDSAHVARMRIDGERCCQMAKAEEQFQCRGFHSTLHIRQHKKCRFSCHASNHATALLYLQSTITDPFQLPTAPSFICRAVRLIPPACLGNDVWLAWGCATITERDHPRFVSFLGAFRLKSPSRALRPLST